MDNNSEKYLNEFTAKIMREVNLETPSEDFTANIMAQVKSIHAKDVTTYKPLISNRVWIFISIGFIALLAYLVFGSAVQQSNELFTINFEGLFNNKFTKALFGLKISDTLTYAILSLAFMVLVQITFLKNDFNRRFEF